MSVQYPDVNIASEQEPSGEDIMIHTLVDYDLNHMSMNEVMNIAALALKEYYGSMPEELLAQRYASLMGLNDKEIH